MNRQENRAGEGSTIGLKTTVCIALAPGTPSVSYLGKCYTLFQDSPYPD